MTNVRKIADAGLMTNEMFLLKNTTLEQYIAKYDSTYSSKPYALDRGLDISYKSEGNLKIYTMSYSNLYILPPLPL